MKTIFAPINIVDFAPHLQINTRLLAFKNQHINDILRRIIAEQLAKLFFVIGNFVTVNKRDEIMLVILPKRRFAEMRVG